MVAVGLAACSSTDTTSTTTTTGTGATAASGTVVAVGVSTANPTGDILSPTQTVNPGETFPTDASAVPSDIITALSAKKSMLVFFYDPTTHVSADERSEINSVMKKHRGEIELFALDYTAGISSSDTSTTLDAETQKIELLSSALKVTTTPYIVLVDGSGRITYRFAGYVDRTLLTREVLRATE
jgi:hypothetical protein